MAAPAASAGDGAEPRGARAVAPRPARLRLFVALDLPARSRAAITVWRDVALLGREDLRPVPARALHVTLAFLGWTAADRVEEVWEATRGAVALAGLAAPLLSPGAVTGVPRRRPRLLALDVADEGGRAATLSAAVTGALADAGLPEPEDRPFWPHVTLARVRRGARAAPLVGPAFGGSPLALEPFSAGVLSLYRSDPSRSGARYTVLERMGLRA